MGVFTCVTEPIPYLLLWLCSSLLWQPLSSTGLLVSGDTRGCSWGPLILPQTTRRQEQSRMAYPWQHSLIPSHSCPALPCPKGPLATSRLPCEAHQGWNAQLHIIFVIYWLLFPSLQKSKPRLRNRNTGWAQGHAASSWQSWEPWPDKGCPLLICSYHPRTRRRSAG